MGDARRVIIAFLVLLFVIIGIGVLLSKVSKNEGDKPVLGGALEKIFSKTTPTPTPATISFDDDAEEETITMVQDSQPIADSTKGGSNESVNSGLETKGGTPENIPNTGSPTAILVFSLAGLAGGTILRKKS